MSAKLPLVSTEWLENKIGDPNIRILDGSWHLPNTERCGQEEFDDGHIPGSLFFDIDEIADLQSDLPHMMPDDEKMSSRVRAMGIKPSDHIIVYDNSPLATAARVWFMFKNMGHKKVSILDGGLPKWVAEGRPTNKDTTTYKFSHYNAKNDDSRIRHRKDVLSNIESEKEQVVDARARGRYLGTAPEPRPDSRSGHIPGSLSVPFSDLLNDDGTYKTKKETSKIFEKNGVDLTKPVIASCGSGVTACVLLFALDRIGHTKNALYDGSWSEWGTRADTPIVKDEERYQDSPRRAG